MYKKAFAAAMLIFERSKKFPKEETYSLSDQIRRSSRSVCAKVAEAWRKRRYKAAFVAKLSDAESDAAEIQVWIKFAVSCSYLDVDIATLWIELTTKYCGCLINRPQAWTIEQ